MPETKFRAWDVIQKRMLFVGLPLTLVISNNDDGVDWQLFTLVGGKSTPECSSSEGSVLMQYTGLKDKNGKEIYEGDIVRTKWSTYTVAFSSKTFGFRMYKGENHNEPMWRECKIIGNIYENPALI